MTPDFIREALRQVRYPGFSRDIVSFGLVKDVTCEDGQTTVRLEISTRDPKVPEKIFQDCHEILDQLPDVGTVKIDIQIKEAPAAAGASGVGKSSIPGVKRIIAVASGKGGVGKSTVSANLAVALAQSGAKVGLCDCDLYGPSVAQMFGTNERPMANEHDEIIPIEAHGLKLMSMGFLLEDRSPVIVRGPMATRYTQQFLRQVAWGDLDYLVLDLPPGTGDIQLTIVQTVSVDGSVIVTTPQEVALIDARKAVSMFAKVNVPILGLIENMAWFEGDDGKKYPIFGKDGGVREAEALRVPLLGQIPIDMPTGQRGDAGAPVALVSPEENKVSAAFHQIAAGLREKLGI
ncbi:Mrp/NBP35 family ATP-binding protein [Luteolibacter pohnpeiensis]|uniref:Iron-sulfur cluster carrier protein n=1 Tax=Luteolibacter pohnpeiensis TaxID=454153 RepID=A0A934S224_9BACT|nr:Mrp/NBP35 family ATP-binding protein [Luteolibacter pohnpeiensis]MBK1881770.1 Mrp/NBP35 family ATP-binding protein [Luteolibacter pohnpeiensis]